MSEEEFTSETLSKKLRQVQALLDKAEHPNTPPHEAKLAEAMAEKMMAKYRIDEEEARQHRLVRGDSTTMAPIYDEFPICDYESQYSTEYIQLFSMIARHVGNVRMAYSGQSGNDGKLMYIALLVGFESDVKYAEMLFTSLRVHFASTLEPKYDPTLSDKENIYRMRSAGIERRDICHALWGPEGGKRHLEVGRLYKEACADRGENPAVGRNSNAKSYRRSFAEAYVSRIMMRLWDMKQAASLNDTTMVLAGRKEAVDEAFYERFPHLRPVPKERALGEGVTGGPGGTCPKCKKAKSGYCRDHGWLKPGSGRGGKPINYAGAHAGRAAANSADLGAKSQGKGRLDS